MSKATKEKDEAGVSAPVFTVVTTPLSGLEALLNAAEGKDVFTILEEGGTRDDVTVVFKTKEKV